MATYQIEYTDTFGGEPNYSWVKRHTFTVPDHTSKREVMRRAKNLVGLTGVCGSKVELGPVIWFYPYRSCTVMILNEEPF